MIFKWHPFWGITFILPRFSVCRMLVVEICHHQIHCNSLQSNIAIVSDQYLINNTLFTRHCPDVYTIESLLACHPTNNYNDDVGMASADLCMEPCNFMWAQCQSPFRITLGEKETQTMKTPSSCTMQTRSHQHGVKCQKCCKQKLNFDLFWIHVNTLKCIM